jgi:hypothetical protein
MHATDQPNHARAHWHKALDFYTELGSPLAREIKAHLNTLNPAKSPSA